MEKACLPIIFYTQKICHDMFNHATKLIHKIDSLMYLLTKTTLTGHITKWVMLLDEFDIQYADKHAIKGQIITNQLADTINGCLLSSYRIS